MGQHDADCSLPDRKKRVAAPGSNGRLLTVLTLMAMALAPSLAAQPSQIGEWGPLIEGFPVPAVHSIMLHTGKILFFRGDGEDEGGVGDYKTHLLSLDTNEFETISMDANLFCSAHTFLPDGRVLVAGGELEENLGPAHVHIFDPITERWYRQPDMADGRYYPTSVAMGDGTTLIFAGRDPDGGKNPRVERFIPGGGPDGDNIIEYINGSDRTMTWYPRMHLLPSGRVVRTGQEEETFEFDPVTGNWDFVADTNHGERYWGTSVILPPGFEKILILGGVNRSQSSFATNTAEIIDFSESFPSWRYTSPMSLRRMHPNVVVLPDGKVFVAGGMEDQANTLPVYESEIFDPVTEAWTVAASQDSVRRYHSSSVLLPDARVMWLGAHAGTGGNDSSTAQIYSPAYLFNGPQPSVQSSPESADYGETFLVDTAQASDIESVVLIRPSATTHSINMAQRYVAMTFTQADANSLAVTAPTNPNVAPPGYYMLFIVDSEGRPSVAPFVRLGGDLPPVVEAGLDQEIILPGSAELDGTVVDYNGNPGLSTQWTVASGPDSVLFGDASLVDTTATFFSPGLYTLRLTAVDGPFTVGGTLTVTVHPEGRVVVGVDVSSDDAEEKADGSITLTSLDLEMTDYDASGPHNAIGLRFNNIDIANGTQISAAHIQFTSAQTSSVTTNLTIKGHDTDHAAPFTTSLENLTLRTTTTAQVSWSVAPWTVGQSSVAQHTANIAPILEEIVNRPGWSAGNSIAIMISGPGNRVARTYDQNPADAAVLYVDPAGYQACDDGLDNDSDGFIDFPADPGCTTSADPSEWEASRVCDDGLDNDGDGFIDFPEDSGCVSLFDGSESEFESICIDGLDNDGDGLIDFPADPGCVDGDDSTETAAGLVCDDGLDNDGDGLIDYPTDPGCDGPTDPSEIDGLIIMDFSVINGVDDAEEKQDGSVTVTSLDLEMFNYDAGGPHRAVGLRFTGVNVPQGVDITAAHLQFEAAATDTTATSITIEGQATDNAPSFSTALDDVTLRPTTGSSTNWSPAPWIDGHAGPDESTSDISDIIEEVVGRVGWVPGNALALILTGSGERVAATHNASPTSAPTLHVEYVTASPNTAPVVTITAPASGTSVDEGTGLTFTGSAIDVPDGDLSGNITWSSNLDGGLGTGSSVAATLSVGVHTITASATDLGSLTATDAIGVTITASPNTAPVVTITAPATGTSVDEGTGLTFVGSAIDVPDGDLSGNITWSSNLDGGLGTSSSVAATLSVGVHTITASATDLGDLTGTDAISVTITAPPVNTAPVVTITAPASGTSVVEGSPVALAGTATDVEDGGLSASMNWASSVDGPLGTGASLSVVLSKGQHTITASALDGSGLQGTDQINIHVRRGGGRQR